jgi:hypothetical protein
MIAFIDCVRGSVFNWTFCSQGCEFISDLSVVWRPKVEVTTHVTEINTLNVSFSDGCQNQGHHVSCNSLASYKNMIDVLKSVEFVLKIIGNTFIARFIHSVVCLTTGP